MQDELAPVYDDEIQLSETSALTDKKVQELKAYLRPRFLKAGYFRQVDSRVAMAPAPGLHSGSHERIHQPLAPFYNSNSRMWNQRFQFHTKCTTSCLST